MTVGVIGVLIGLALAAVDFLLLRNLHGRPSGRVVGKVLAKDCVHRGHLADVLKIYVSVHHVAQVHARELEDAADALE